MADLIVPGQKRLCVTFTKPAVLQNGAQPEMRIEIDGLSVQEVALACSEAMKGALGAQEMAVQQQTDRLNSILQAIPEAAQFDRIRGEAMQRQMVS